MVRLLVYVSLFMGKWRYIATQRSNGRKRRVGMFCKRMRVDRYLGRHVRLWEERQDEIRNNKAQTLFAAQTLVFCHRVCQANMLQWGKEAVLLAVASKTGLRQVGFTIMLR